MSLTLRAIINPEDPMLTEDLERFFAVAADNFIIPPFALSKPELEIRLFSVFPFISLIIPNFSLGTETLIKPSPTKSSVIFSPAPRAIFPSLAETIPALDICPPKRAPCPLSPIIILPLF